MSLEERLYSVLFNVDRERHITVRTEVCFSCAEKPCAALCPAQCYSVAEGELEFNYEGCLECGTCRKVCAAGAIDWKYPRGGFGVHFRYG
jgi:ferredoxin like protein